MTDLADLYAKVAIDGVTRVRDEDPADLHRWLRNAMHDVREQAHLQGRYVSVEESYVALASVLFAAVPDDRAWSELTEWIVRQQAGRGGAGQPESAPPPDLGGLRRPSDLQADTGHAAHPTAA
jgi:hypothetical protein